MPGIPEHHRWRIKPLSPSAPSKPTTRSARHQAKHTPPSSYIVRMMLANGYWSYGPEELWRLPGAWPHLYPRRGPGSPRDPWSGRRGAVDEGRVSLSYLPKGQKRVAEEHRRIEVSDEVWAKESWDALWQWDDAPVPGHRRRLRRRLERSGCRVRWKEVRNLEKEEDEEEEEEEEEEKRERVPVGAAPVATAPVTKSPVKLWDDPVEDGKELAAAAEVLLPSDKPYPRNLGGVDVISREELEMADLWRQGVLSQAEEDLTLNSIVHDEPTYAVKVIQRKKRGKRGRREDKTPDVRQSVSEPATEITPSSGPTHDSDCDCWKDMFRQLEAQGWVAVAGRLDEGREDRSESEWELASTAGSWTVMEENGYV
ncbi:hypothetical protein B0H67DRAFT_556301 [Lasiosphaeris hirsuta]|uniref:Uncharacterized protein n=1 Tax=Lasiosphaeris hirsuta TaxID=260670 RepID=A0AA40A1L1_9PEZI|nr:hypothetical protein B0H67DRAFT_556301 [Lasiosphaeris hirsuta]